MKNGARPIRLLLVVAAFLVLGAVLLNWRQSGDLSPGIGIVPLLLVVAVIAGREPRPRPE